ncbi:MAG: hypothetical protein ACJ746_11020 [Bryobacteraceae bacterium]
MKAPGESVISLRTALLLYLVLVVLSFSVLTGNARILALLIVGALAAKSIIHYYRDRME